MNVREIKEAEADLIMAALAFAGPRKDYWSACDAEEKRLGTEKWLKAETEDYGSEWHAAAAAYSSAHTILLDAALALAAVSARHEAEKSEEEARNWHIRRDERNGRHTP